MLILSLALAIAGDRAIRVCHLNQHGQAITVSKFSETHESQIEQLLATAKLCIKSPIDHGLAAIAIRKLGILRAERAVPFLIDHLSFQGLGAGFAAEQVPTTEEVFPSVYSLSRIGYPAFAPLLAKAENTDSDYTHWLVARSFYLAIGNDDAILFIKSRADRQENREKKRRLLSLIKCLNEINELGDK